MLLAAVALSTSPKQTLVRRRLMRSSQPRLLLDRGKTLQCFQCDVESLLGSSMSQVACGVDRGCRSVAFTELGRVGRQRRSGGLTIVCSPEPNSPKKKLAMSVGRRSAGRAVRSARGTGGAGGSVSRARAINLHELRGNEAGQAAPQRYAHDTHDDHGRADATGSKLGNERCPDRQHAADAVPVPCQFHLSGGRLDWTNPLGGHLGYPR